MKALFGFGDFDTSKFKDHSATSVEAVHKSKSVQSQYRQYMNRKGGYNRPLDN